MSRDPWDAEVPWWVSVLLLASVLTVLAMSLLGCGPQEAGGGPFTREWVEFATCRHRGQGRVYFRGEIESWSSWGSYRVKIRVTRDHFIYANRSDCVFENKRIAEKRIAAPAEKFIFEGAITDRRETCYELCDDCDSWVWPTPWVECGREPEASDCLTFRDVGGGQMEMVSEPCDE